MVQSAIDSIKGIICIQFLKRTSESIASSTRSLVAASAGLATVLQPVVKI